MKYEAARGAAGTGTMPADSTTTSGSSDSSTSSTDEGSGSKRSEDIAARDSALDSTLNHLADHL